MFFRYIDMSGEVCDPVHVLNKDLVLFIFSRVTLKCILVVVELVSKDWNALLTDSFWQRLCGILNYIPLLPTPDPNWKLCFIENKTGIVERDLKFVTSEKVPSRSRCISDSTLISDETWSAFETNKTFYEGKHYWEVSGTFHSEQSCFIFVGVCFPGQSTHVLGEANCWCFSPYYQDLRYDHQTLARPVGRKIARNELLGIYLDCDKQTLNFYIGGEPIERGFTKVTGGVTPVVSLALGEISLNPKAVLPRTIIRKVINNDDD